MAEALISQGITVLRYGGSMVNNPEYRWKKMTGPRDWLAFALDIAVTGIRIV